MRSSGVGSRGFFLFYFFFFFFFASSPPPLCSLLQLARLTLEGTWAESGRAAGWDTEHLLNLSSLDHFPHWQKGGPSTSHAFLFSPPDGRCQVSKQPCGRHTKNTGRAAGCVFARSRHMASSPSRTPEAEAAAGGEARKTFLTSYEEPLPESLLASLDTSVAAFLLQGDR